MNDSSIINCAKSLFKQGKGILAADESTPTMNKRLRAIGVPEEPEMRRKFRQLLFTAPGIEEYLSGTIMYDSSIRNQTDDGTLFVDILTTKGIIPIIKVDKSTIPHDGFEDEVVTQGLDDLEERLREYYELGARACKWRAVFRISKDTPSEQNILYDCMTMARYAALCHKCGLVPIVEPEVLYEGTHNIDTAEAVTSRVLKKLMDTLKWYKVDISGVIVKTGMVLAGSENEVQSTPEEVAEATIRTFKSSLPEELAGVVFLSGGQTDVQATANLNAISKLEDQLPFPTTFSFSRAIEQPILDTWSGREENVEAAQKVMLHRLKMNALAEAGEYNQSLEQD